jgi:DNA invertase Pin-like site-specific DNA recombinase
MRVAIYARVSTEEQDADNQLLQLREWAKDHKIIKEYVDHESGAKADRKAFTRLFDDASKRRFDLVLFWSLDRFSREGMIPTIFHLQRLEAYGVKVHSFTEPHVSTDNEMTRNLLLAMYSTVAKQERLRISERTRAGLQKAVRNGKKLGRPKIASDREALVRAAIERGDGIVRTAKALGVGVGTVLRIKREAMP